MRGPQARVLSHRGAYKRNAGTPLHQAPGQNIADRLRRIFQSNNSSRISRTWRGEYGVSRRPSRSSHHEEEDSPMERRSFLSSILAASATLPFVGHARAAEPSHELHGEGVEREFLIQESPVAGFQYHDGESVWLRLSEGDLLQLLREPDNPYDRRAIAVYWSESKLGYVPRAANTAVSQMMDRGERLTARIMRLRESRNPWKRVELSIAARIAV